VTIGIAGIDPSCSGLTERKVPVNTVVFYCYTVHNSTGYTPTVHTLTDSQWGLLLDQMPLALLPGESYSYVISRTIQVTTTNTATWTTDQPTLAVAFRSFFPAKLKRQPAATIIPVVAKRWVPIGFQSEARTLNRSATATVYVSSPTDDQDGDRIPDNVESANDFDGDNLPNFLDQDADNDGAPDASEGNVDQDEDGYMDYVDPGVWVPDPTVIDPETGEPQRNHKIYLPLIVR
jgi:hypothetical protein